MALLSLREMGNTRSRGFRDRVYKRPEARLAKGSVTWGKRVFEAQKIDADTVPAHCL